VTERKEQSTLIEILLHFKLKATNDLPECVSYKASILGEEKEQKQREKRKNLLFSG
jgi:hypothetical protein